MSAKAISYAEDTLGVHEVYKRVQEDRETLDRILTDLSEARDLKRAREAKLLDREMELAEIERGSNPEMSQAAMERHLKSVIWRDGPHRECRQSLSQVQSDIDGLEQDKHMADTDIKIGVARMNELGGYLEYLASVKNSARCH